MAVRPNTRVEAAIVEVARDMEAQGGVGALSNLASRLAPTQLIYRDKVATYLSMVNNIMRGTKKSMTTTT